MVSFEMAELINRVGHAITPGARAGHLLAATRPMRLAASPPSASPSRAPLTACTGDPAGRPGPPIRVGRRRRAVRTVPGGRRGPPGRLPALPVDPPGPARRATGRGRRSLDEAAGERRAVSAGHVAAGRPAPAGGDRGHQRRDAATLLRCSATGTVPLVGSNGRPAVADVTAVWNTSFLPDGAGPGPRRPRPSSVNGPVWTMGTDTQSGRDDVLGFAGALQAAGGRLANERPDATVDLGHHELPALPRPGAGQRREGGLLPLRRAPRRSVSSSSTPSPTPVTCRCSRPAC